MAWEGNRLYDEAHYDEAEIFYRKALEENAVMPEGQFNLGNTSFHQKRYDEAASRFAELGARGDLPAATRAAAFYNQGNALFEGGDYGKAVEAYKQSLRLRPGDENTKYNLSMAQTMLKKQQEQEQQNPDQQQDQQNQDQQQQQDQQNQDQQQQDNQQQNQDQQKEDKQEQQKPGQQGEQDQQQEQQGEPKELNMSPEELERILEALEQDEKDVQRKINAQKVKGAKGDAEKDW